MSENGIKTRIGSIDQFRGFAVFGMILVNYLGYFSRMPETLKHPHYGMTFANTIAPFFLIAVGMGFRMSLAKRIKTDGPRRSYAAALKRYLILIIIGIVLYGPDPVCDMWDALTDIGFAGILTLPFILSSKRVRYLMAILYLVIYQCIFIFTGYGTWTMEHSIDGGPLGTLSWAAILFFGTILSDELTENQGMKFIRRAVISGTILTVSGILLSVPAPHEWWAVSQRSMTMAYPILASGISFIVFAVFYWLSDIKKLSLPHLTILGMNPLVLYIVQNVLIEYHGTYLAQDSSPWAAMAGFAVIYGICYIVADYLYRNKLFIKI